MQRVVLLTVGKVKESWAKEAAAFYDERLKRALKFEVVELPASKEKDQQKQKEPNPNAVHRVPVKPDDAVPRFILLAVQQPPEP